LKLFLKGCFIRTWESKKLAFAEGKSRSTAQILSRRSPHAGRRDRALLADRGKEFVGRKKKEIWAIPGDTKKKKQATSSPF